MPHISVLTTIYNTAEHLEELYRQTTEVLREITDDYEFVFVDDGSPDNSLEVVQRLIERDARVRCVELSRNFGHHRAVMCGLEHVRGDYVFLFDSDLDEDPKYLKRFYDKMQERPGEVDVVYGRRSVRTGSLFYRLSGMLHYKLLNFMSDMHIPENQATARLMTREYVQSLLEYKESNVYLAGVMTLAGFHQEAVEVTKVPQGESSYTFRRKLTQALDGLLAFTNKPLTYIFLLGVFLSMFAILAALIMVIRLVAQGVTIEGWTLVLVSVWFLGGLIIAFIGTVGIYVGRIFLQVKRRPNAVVRKIHART